MEGIFNKKPAAQDSDVDPKALEMLKEAIPVALIKPEEKAMIDTPEKLHEVSKRVLGYLDAHNIELTVDLVQSAGFVDALSGALSIAPSTANYMVTDKEGMVVGLAQTKKDTVDLISKEKTDRGPEGAGSQ